MVILTTALAVLLTGSLVYCVLIVIATRRFLSATLPAPGDKPPISVLKPLCGHDDGLEENLRSFMTQDYPGYEVLFGVHRSDDPAVAVAEKIIAELSGRIRARLVITGESPIPNAKAFSLNRLVREARYDVLVMSDSDVRVTPTLLSHLAQEFQDDHIGLISCPYRAVAGKSLWSRLEAIGMNTELLGGVMVARMIEGMRFALGCTVAVRRSVLEDMGGFGYLQEFLAEDFVIGQRAAELGHGVLFSSYVIEHRIGSQNMMLQPGTPYALGAQHAPLASAGLLGTDFHLSAAACASALRCLSRSLAGVASYNGPARRRGGGHSPRRCSRSCHAEAMVVAAGSGCHRLLCLDQRLCR